MDISDTLVKGEGSLYLTEEVTPGTYVAPSLDEHGVEPITDSIEFNRTQEKIDRNTLTSTVEAVESRRGAKSVTGSVAIEMKAGKTPGARPRGSVLFKSLLGGERQITTTTTTGTDHTTTEINIPNTAIGKYKKNDVILIKEAGNYQVRPILAVDDTEDEAKITLAIALSSAPADAVVIEKVTMYHFDSASPAMSATYFPGGKIREKYTGVKAISASLDNWTANSTPSINFSLEGIDVEKDIASPSVDVDFSNDSKVPVMMGAYAWLGDEALEYIELGLSIENTKADLPSAASPAGKIGSRKTRFAPTGTINPYMTSDNLDRWNSFENDEMTSLFAYAYNPTSTEGEFEQIVAIWMPNVKITNMPAADQDGVLLDSIEFESVRKDGKDTLFLAFI